MKNPFKKSKKEKFPTQPVPRTADEIMKAWQELRARAGELQYNVYVYEQELNQLNEALKSLNYEMAERQKLDKASAAEKAKEDAKTNTVPTQEQPVQ